MTVSHIHSSKNAFRFLFHLLDGLTSKETGHKRSTIFYWPDGQPTPNLDYLVKWLSPLENPKSNEWEPFQQMIRISFGEVAKEACENTRAAWQLFFTARTWAKPHRFDSSVTLLLRRVVQSKTQWHSNVLKLLKLLQKSSQASKTFFQPLQIKRLQLKLTNNLQNYYQMSSQHQVPKTWVKQHPKTPKPQKQTKIHLQALPCTNWFHLVPNWFLPGSYRFLWAL